MARLPRRQRDAGFAVPLPVVLILLLAELGRLAELISRTARRFGAVWLHTSRCEAVNTAKNDDERQNYEQSFHELANFSFDLG